MTHLPQLNICDKIGQVHVSIDGSGKVTGFCGHVDLGQGIEVALAQIVAEELDFALEDVAMVLGKTAATPDQGPTIASETIQVTAIPLRRAAATLRHELARRAALQLNAAASDIGFDRGHACAVDRKLPIGSLIEAADTELLIDETTEIKDPSQYKIVGHKTGRRDLLAKVSGDFNYIHDIKVDGMLHAHVIRPPYSGRDSGPFVGTSLIGYDEAEIADRDGFIAVVRQGDLLGVVATQPDIARALAEALPVHWRMPPELPNMGALADTIREQPSTERVLDIAGDIDSALHSSDKHLKRSYVWPYQMHGSIGPSCAVADWANGVPVVWCGSQNPHMLRGDLAQLVGLEPEDIDVRRYQAAGCYGRNCADDVAGDALIMSRAVGHPVRVQLTRAQENLWEPKGAAQIMDVEGGLKDGRFHAYRLDTWYPSNRGPNLALLLTGVMGNHPQPVEMGDRTIVPPYVIPHKRITVHDLAPVVRASWFRGVSALPNTFAHECFIDELASEAGADPVEFRLQHIEDTRAADLIQRTAEAAGWDHRTGPRLRREGRMAYGRGFSHATYVHGNFPGVAAASAAWVCDVAVDTETGEVTLTRVFVGQDQGLVINPDGVRQQIHGNVHQTTGRVLGEQVTFDSIEQTQKSWGDYPIMTFPQAPEIETMLIERPDEPPLGVGESAAVPSASAIASAIFDATGVRLREVPFTPERMRTELRQAGYFVQGDAPVKRKFNLRKRMTAATVAIGGALAVGAVAMPLYRAIAPTSPPPANSFSTELLEQGRQVFAAGNCIDCHTALGGIPGAGGKPFATPFGTIYSSNISSDPETGLGGWSYDAFNRAMRKGISRDGSNLYPAFPYTSFAGMSDDDMFAVYAYIQSRPAVEQPTPQAQMTFPANLRPTNIAWNWMFHTVSAPLESLPTQSDAWNRGRYLVETVGHCSACHTPRNALGAEKTGESRFTGAMVNGWYAPPLAGPEAAARGWNAASLGAYLQTGHSEGIAAAAGPMAEVASNLQVLPQADIEAMSLYLESLLPETPVPIATTALSTEPMMLNTPSHRIFEASCAACHEPAVSGMFTAAQVPLGQSMAIRAPSSQAVKTIISQGLHAPNNLSLRDMPSFSDDLSATQMDEMAQYLRERYAPDLDSWPRE
jgi:nicotinate dehydrogenase subunit B